MGVPRDAESFFLHRENKCLSHRIGLSFIQQTFIKLLLCTRHAGHRGPQSHKTASSVKWENQSTGRQMVVPTTISATEKTKQRNDCDQKGSLLDRKGLCEGEACVCLAI